jgi:hypothetical protein
MLPGPDCPHKRETFVPGTEPRAVCDWHRRVDGRRQLVWPAEVAGWARVHRTAHRSGQAAPLADLAPGTKPSDELQIVYPSDGAHFLLDPGRPPAEQRPPLHAIPAAASVHWTIDGAPAESWIPRTGKHVLRAELGATHREVEFDFD